jgi:energy-coupling factor transporter transmembrane protein EcfT
MQLTLRRVKSLITSLLSVALSQASKLVTSIKIRTDGGAKINIRNRTKKSMK